MTDRTSACGSALSFALPMVLFGVLAPIGAQAESKPLRVLFVGNSYTYYQDLDHQLSKLSAEVRGGRKIVCTRLTKGGATLERHWNEGQAAKLIASKRFDVVVLQGQSMAAIVAEKRLRKYAGLFTAEIRKSGARPVLFMTWARQHRPKTQATISRVYDAIGSDVGAEVAPVGIAWRTALKQRPALPLHQKDRSHPNPHGTFLAAAVFYSTLLHRKAETEGFVMTRAAKPATVILKLAEANRKFLVDLAWKACEARAGRGAAKPAPAGGAASREYDALVGSYVAEKPDGARFAELRVTASNGNLILESKSGSKFRFSPPDKGRRWHQRGGSLRLSFARSGDQALAQALRLEDGDRVTDYKRK